jgi:GST-like protein
VLDLYLLVMSYWRPGRQWYRESCPKLLAITRAAKALPKVGDVIRRNMS